MTRTTADLPEYLQNDKRVPASLLALEPEALVALLCDVALATFNSVEMSALDRELVVPRVEALRAGAPVQRVDLRAGVIEVLHTLTHGVRLVRESPTAFVYAMAWLDAKRGAVACELFYTKLSRGSKAGRAKLKAAVEARVDGSLAAASYDKRVV